MTPRRELLPDTTGKDTQRNSYRLLSHAQDRHRFSEGKADVVSSSLSNHPLAKGKISHLQWCLTGCTNHTPGQSHEQELWDNTKQKVFFVEFCFILFSCHFMSCWYADCFKCNFVFRWALPMCFLDFVSYFIVWFEREKEHEFG